MKIINSEISRFEELEDNSKKREDVLCSDIRKRRQSSEKGRITFGQSDRRVGTIYRSGSTHFKPATGTAIFVVRVRMMNGEKDTKDFIRSAAGKEDRVCIKDITAALKDMKNQVSAIKENNNVSTYSSLYRTLKSWNRMGKKTKNKNNKQHKIEYKLLHSEVN